MVVECIECLDKYREQDCKETIEGEYVCGNCIGYYEGELKMKEYDVIVTLEILRTVEAGDEDEAIQMVEELLWEDHTQIMDNLGYEVNEA